MSSSRDPLSPAAEPSLASVTLTRRQALQAAAATLAAGGLFSSLAGCGGSGGSGGNDFKLRQVTGTVNVEELGGSAPWRTVSPYDEGGALTNGGFSVKASGEGAQLLTVVDADGEARGMTIALPGASTEVDAESTAMAAVFLTPGLASSNPDQAAALVTAIRGHTSFPDLAARARALLPTGSLTSFRDDAEAQSLLAEITEDLTNQLGPRGTNPSNPAIAFKASWGKGPGTVQQVAFENGSYRFVRLDEVKLNADKQRLGSPTEVKDTSGKKILAMPSVTMLSLGSLLTGTIGSPSTATGQTNLLQPLGGVRYKVYVSGPGTGLVGEQSQFPRSWSDVQESWQKTAINLVLMPIIDVVMGAVGASARVGAKILSAVGGVYSTYPTFLSGSAAYDAASSGDLKAMAAAFIDAIFAFVALGAFAVTVVVAGAALLGVTLGGGVVAAAVGLALGGVAALMSGINMAATARKILTYPSVESVELPLSSAEVIVR